MKRKIYIAIMLIICIVFVSACTASPTTNSVSLVVGQQYKLTTDYKVNEWISSNTSVATVENGIITALSVGEATITAKGKDGYSCFVTVNADELSLSHNSIRIGKGSTFALKSTTKSGLIPQFTSSDNAIITVDEKGIITANNVGQAVVFVKMGSQQLSCNVTVVDSVQIFAAKTHNPAVAVNQTTTIDVQMTAYDSQAGAFKPINSGFIYESSDKNIATVDANGIIVGVSVGKAYITVSHRNYDLICQCEVSVVDKIDNFDFTDINHINIYGRVKQETYQGKKAIKLVNGASAFELTFEGSELSASIASTSDWAHNYLRVFVDGVENKIKINASNSYTNVTLASGLGEGLHTLIAYKVHEEERNTIYVAGFDGATGYYNPPEKPQLKIDVYGDSITAGYCSLLEQDQGNYPDTSDCTQTYAFWAKRQLNAQINVFAMSGISLAVPLRKDIPLVKDCYMNYSVKDSTAWNFAEPADIIVINLGTNDSVAISNGIGTIDTFINAYKQFIANLRTLHPNAHIICVYGMMAGGDVVASSIQEMVSTLNQTDSKIYCIKLGKADNGHPGNSTHQESGQILADYISTLIEK